MPSTVVRIADNAFRGCQLLNSITAPGCIEFGYKAFADCCSLQWVHANGGGANQFGSATKLGHYLFRDCISLATFVLLEDGRQQEPQTQAGTKELLPGCLRSTGITTLELTRDFQVLGAHACDNCKLLKQVDISNASIEEIQEFTFVHCASLREVKLPYSWYTIRVKAFMNCSVLPELAIPPSLHYIASRAFLDCTALSRLTKLPGRHRWRGTYAEENAFCHMPCHAMAAVAAHDPRPRLCVRLSLVRPPILISNFEVVILQVCSCARLVPHTRRDFHLASTQRSRLPKRPR